MASITHTVLQRSWRKGSPAPASRDQRQPQERAERQRGRRELVGQVELCSLDMWKKSLKLSRLDIKTRPVLC